MGCLEKQISILGLDHQESQGSIDNLARLCDDQDDEDAVAWLFAMDPGGHVPPSNTSNGVSFILNVLHVARIQARN